MTPTVPTPNATTVAPVATNILRPLVIFIIANSLFCGYRLKFSISKDQHIESLAPSFIYFTHVVIDLGKIGKTFLSNAKSNNSWILNTLIE